jgi:hypothetical protein
MCFERCFVCIVEATPKTAKFWGPPSWGCCKPGTLPKFNWYFFINNRTCDEKQGPGKSYGTSRVGVSSTVPFRNWSLTTGPQRVNQMSSRGCVVHHDRSYLKYMKIFVLLTIYFWSYEFYPILFWNFFLYRIWSFMTFCSWIYELDTTVPDGKRCAASSRN